MQFQFRHSRSLSALGFDEKHESMRRSFARAVSGHLSCPDSSLPLRQRLTILFGMFHQKRAMPVRSQGQENLILHAIKEREGK